MQITFRVKKVHKGDLKEEVRLGTGVGGGDCGVLYQTGLDYLVYAYARKSGDLVVSMCSPGGWLGSNYLATELRYLRKEHPSKADLAPMEYWTPAAIAQRDREREEYVKRYTAATGQICGSISPKRKSDDQLEHIAFLSTAGYAPFPHATVEVDREGRFCSDRLGPGRYYLFYTHGLWKGSMKSALYYPGVAEQASAKSVEIGASQVRTDIVFHIVEPPTYAVRGFISADDKSGFGKDDVALILVGLDGRIWGQEVVDFSGRFPLPRLKYFSFGEVVPGRYLAYAVAPGRNCLTRIVEVNVARHSKLVFLELKHTKR
jgi:hypothetical protein